MWCAQHMVFYKHQRLRKFRNLNQKRQHVKLYRYFNRRSFFRRRILMWHHSRIGLYSHNPNYRKPERREFNFTNRL